MLILALSTRLSSDVLAPLVGGMTSLLALFTGVGLTADRLAVVFNGGTARIQLKVSVVSDGDTHATLSFTVTANGVKKDNLLRAFAIWVRDTTTVQPGQTPHQEPPFYVATLRPDDKGVVSQEVSILIDRPASAQKIRLQVYWDTSASRQQAPTSAPTTFRSPAPVGALCANQGNARVAAACAEVEVEAAVTPTPTAS